MTKYNRLRLETLEATTFRGHDMSRFTRNDLGRIRTGTRRHTTGLAYCRTYHGQAQCRAWAMIDTDPAPNGIDIGGPAIAIGCPE